MPIEVREIIIHAVVNDRDNQRNSHQQSSENMNQAVDEKRLIDLLAKFKSRLKER